MAPIAREVPTAHALDADESLKTGQGVVISGVSGLFPQSHHVKDLSHILYNKINPVSKDTLRWSYPHPEAARETGNVPDIDRFDAQFFKVHYRLSTNMEPSSRRILEHTYQAIYDAGVNPGSLSGRKIGVFIGTGYAEAEKFSMYSSSTKTGFGIPGCSKSMFANRVSYWLNLKGPSIAVEQACCSSTAALEKAFQSIAEGECEAAIVGASTLCLLPHSSMHHERLMQICPDGKTKSFDENADGYAKSEGIAIFFLQKAKDALRIYAEIVSVRNEFTSIVENESGPVFGFYRNPKATADFMKQIYKDAGVNPEEVEYVEAFGTAVPEADKAELEAIDDVFCRNRKEPLLVGSIISNIGYTESVSGMNAITKVLLAYQSGQLAANLHCENPRRDVAGLREGRISIVREHTPFKRTYTAVNGLSVSGVNSHVLLHGRYKPKDLEKYKSSIPHLVTISARQESNTASIIQDLKSRPRDPEELALLHNLHDVSTPGHLSRGFVLLDTDKNNNTVSLHEKCEYFDDAKRPLWFVYSGMGSQWSGMGKHLMSIPIFAAAIQTCQRVLEPKGLDLLHIITSPDKTVFDDILHSFVGIAAIQIGLTDILRALDLVPDNIIGHSVGELGCAYADGCISAEEMILAAYYRGLVSKEVPFILGSMAAVGMGYSEIQKLCPPEIDVACHNSAESCTISGPKEILNKFVSELTEKSIFAKEVPCSNIAYHSRYIAKAGPHLRKYLAEVFKSPKLRSERWVSTSVPQEKWEEPAAKYCSAEYHTNNLLNPVLFEETSKVIPSNAVLVEVAPHGLLQAILKRSLATCHHIPLTRRAHPDSAVFLLNAIGDLYMSGYNPKIKALYPKVEFPVSSETPSLGHLIQWAHTEKWYLPMFQNYDKNVAAACKFIISIYDDEYGYLRGNVVKGKTVFPFAAVLTSVWDTLAMILGKEKKKLSVEFTDVHLHSQPILHERRQLCLHVSLQKGRGRFEVMDDVSLVASGYISALETKADKLSEADPKITEELTLKTDDVYRLLHDKDFSYSGEFRSIVSANTSLTEAQLNWSNNWASLIDGLLQLNVLRQPHSAASEACVIRKLTIDVEKHIEATSESNVVAANASDVHDYTSCGGISIHNIKYQHFPALVTDVELKSLKIDNSLLKNVTDIKNVWNESNLEPLKENLSPSKVAQLQIGQIGDFDSLHWAEVPLPKGLGVPVTVHYAGISTNDLKRAIEVNASNADFESNAFGMDFSGVTDSGCRVMGLVQNGALKSHLLANTELLWPVPAHWSLEDAATVPLAYCYAFYCLCIKSRILPCYNILIHGGAGALGQAAISIALAYGCRVFATVSDSRKKRFLKRIFPALNEDDIGNSRDSSFADMVLSATKGYGCDIILSCLKGQLKNVTLTCCAHSGVTYDATQIQNKEDFNFGMYNLTRSRNYKTLDISTIFLEENALDRQYLQVLLSEGIARGAVRPLSRVSYASDAAPRAFRLLAASGHRGRALLELHAATARPDATPRLICAPESTQMILINDDNFGLNFVDKLVAGGATKILIHCAELSNYVMFKIKALEKRGVDVKVTVGGLKDAENVTFLLNESNKHGSVEGIYLALSNVGKAVEDLNVIVDALDKESRKLCPLIKHFAVLTDHSTLAVKTCLERVKNKLPATLVYLPTLQKISELNGPTNGLSWRGALDAAEKAILSPQSLTVARAKNSAPIPLLKQISTVTDINISENVNQNTTLQDLGVDSTKLQVVSTLLRQFLGITIKEDDLPRLTVNRLNEIEAILTEAQYDEVKGLGKFVSYVDANELLATAEIVQLSTYGVNINMENELDLGNSYLTIIPGIESHYGKFTTLTQRLKLRALVLQSGLDGLKDTTTQLAKRYYNTLKKRARIIDNFYLVGYEGGVSAVLELAALLENEGLTGTVFCIGHTPDEFQAIVKQELNAIGDEEAIREAIARYMVTLMTGEEPATLLPALREASTWQEKLDICARITLGRVDHSMQYTKYNIDAVYQRLINARDETIKPKKLRSKVILLNDSRSSLNSSAVKSLQQYSEQNVLVYPLKSYIPYTAQDLQCTAIINRHLHPDILEEFRNVNICETYPTQSG